MDVTDESAYDRMRAAQWRTRGGISRRGLLRMSAGIGLGTAVGGVPAGRAAAADGPIVKPLPPELFVVYGSNAEMRWEAMRGQGYHTPTDRFFVRDHTSTPLIDVRTWRLRLFGAGLHGAPTLDRAVEFSYEDLLALPSRSISAFIECTGNGRSFYTTQQGQTVTGSPWKLGAVGVARWRGVPLSTVLERAGLTKHAVDVMPRGLDPDYVDGGKNLGKVRRPLPVAKALDDVLLAYEMNGRPLPPDHGFPVRLVVPTWVGISSIKWVGDIEVSDAPLFSPWNTQYYRLFGPGYPPEGSAPLTRQVIKSAFELPWDATLSAGRTTVLNGRSWSGNGAVRRVEVSTDGGAHWRRALPHGPANASGWLRWEFPWRPETTGSRTLLARATDATGASQPDVARYNTLGYLFDGVVRHPVTVA
ncbi:MAG: oxidoreductase molybdopterin binding protein [Actinoallomurus sp.]|jgi:DMSO/TMAO reductase YedYZ molybdopterin-dependent catalytic subunit|nr:oxidoreductase molybdopterin binding protein [Actinoallomurus sp.]